MQLLYPCSLPLQNTNFYCHGTFKYYDFLVPQHWYLTWQHPYLALDRASLETCQKLILTCIMLFENLLADVAVKYGYTRQ